eukprot:m.61767 g.61767  ORF g.61767 m.61767 type:complete len:336 (+) comp8005_c0_seq2:223-1230(+)
MGALRMRFSSSVIVCAKYLDSFKVLMIERPSMATSFSNAFVFPGGVLDKKDRVDGVEITRFDGKETTTLQSLALAAKRELFEEVGLNVPKVTPFFRLVTPIPKPYYRAPSNIRFDTSFFVSVIDQPPSQIQLDPCPKEVQSFAWFSPEEVLKRHSESNLYTVAPQLYALSLLKDQNIHHLLEEMAPISSWPILPDIVNASVVGHSHSQMSQNSSNDDNNINNSDASVPQAEFVWPGDSSFNISSVVSTEVLALPEEEQARRRDFLENQWTNVWKKGTRGSRSSHFPFFGGGGIIPCSPGRILSCVHCMQRQRMLVQHLDSNATANPNTIYISDMK